MSGFDVTDSIVGASRGSTSVLSLHALVATIAVVSAAAMYFFMEE